MSLHSPTRLDLIRRRMPLGRRNAQQRKLPGVVGVCALSLLYAVVLFLIMVFNRDSSQLTATSLIGLGLLIAGAVSLFAYYISRFGSERMDAGPRRVLFAVVALVVLLVARIEHDLDATAPWAIFLVPVPLAGILLTVVYNQRLAFDTVIMIFLLMLTQTMVFGPDTAATRAEFAELGTLFFGTAIAILATQNLRSRTSLLKVGLYSGVVMALAQVVFALLGFWNFSLLSSPELLVLVVAHGLAAGVLATSLIPVLEHLFGIVTDVRLLELEEGNHPLLQMMMERAPGTYMHTQNVARLVSAAAQAIGANPLLARVGTLFHDIGKMVRPEYFTENERNSKLFHERLHPTMSGMIIISHVKEGVALAREYRLPRVLEDFITGHHGTSAVAYFYRIAKMQAKEGEYVEESQFRYPGPKPQTREAALLAIADLVEASGRAKLEGTQTPASLQKFVRECVLAKLNDGQFDECDLTVRDLRLAEEAFVRTLASMYHHRVKYPDDPDERKLKLAVFEKEEYRKHLTRRKEDILTQ